MKEVFKDIPGYEGSYQVSNMGRIKSLERDIRVGSVTRHQPEIIMKLIVNNHGYQAIVLKRKIHLIHRLVAKVFIPNPQNLPEVDHIDNNKRNNTVDNLRWISRSENCLKSRKENSDGHLNRQDREEVCYRRRIKIRVVETGEDLGSIEDVAEVQKCTPPTVINHTRRGTAWRDGLYKGCHIIAEEYYEKRTYEWKGSIRLSNPKLEDITAEQYLQDLQTFRTGSIKKEIEENEKDL